MAITPEDIQNYVETDENNEILPLQTSVIVTKNISNFCHVIEQDQHDLIKFHKMPSGFILVVKTLSFINFDNKIGSEIEFYAKVENLTDQLLTIPQFETLDLATLNYCMYKCNEEELDYTNGKRGVFRIDGVPIMYAGIASLIHIIRFLKVSQNLGSPLFDNIRQGNWLMDYIVERFEDHPKTKFIADNLTIIFDMIKIMPNSEKPRYFSKVISNLWDAMTSKLS